MTVAEVAELFDFNAWANRRIFAALGRVTPDAYHRDLGSSHGGLHGTLCHIVWAEHLWFGRWRDRPNPAVAQGADLATLDEARGRWEVVETERRGWVARLSEAALEATLTIRPTRGGAYQHPLHQTIRHVVDHSSYHRGQIVTLLRQLGERPPSTGLILFWRERSTGTEILNF